MTKRNKVQIIGGQDVIPHDRETERAVLGTLIRYNEQWEKYSDILNVDMFYEGMERKVFRCIEGVISEGNIANLNSLCEYAERNDIRLTDGMATEYTPADNRHQFAQIVVLNSIYTIQQDIDRLARLSKQRLSWLLLQQVSKNVVDPTLDIDEELQMCMSSLQALQGDRSNESIVSLSDATERLRATIKENATGNKSTLECGFRLFDNHYLLRGTTVTVLAAFTSVGKSSLATNIAVNVASRGVPVAYYSKEMDVKELTSRIFSKAMGISSSFILNGSLNENMQQKFDEVTKERRNLPVYMDERSTVSFERTLRSIRTMVKTKGVRLVVIDYIQIFCQNGSMENDRQEQELGYMIRALKNIAKELDIAVLVLSQLKRGAEHPSINMMRGSGQIEESADHIVLIDRPEAYPDNKVKKYVGEYADRSIQNTAKLILSKGRGVGTGCSLVAFEAKYCLFYDMKSSGEQDAPFTDDAPFTEEQKPTEPVDNAPYRAQQEELPF